MSTNHPSMALNSEIAFWQYRAMIRTTADERRLCQERADRLRQRRDREEEQCTSMVLQPALENKSMNGSTAPKESPFAKR